MQPKNRTLFIAQFGCLLALEAILCFTPLGSIPIGPIVATLALLPVIIAAILLGTAAGAAMGAFAGLFSFWVWTFMPPMPVIAFVFTPFYTLGPFSGNVWSLVICFVPRILVGVVAAVCFKGFLKMFKAGKKDVFAYALSGVLGSLTNTFLVLGGIYVFFGAPYAEAAGIGFDALLGIIGLTVLTNGIPEAIIGALAAYAVCKPIKTYLLKR